MTNVIFPLVLLQLLARSTVHGFHCTHVPKTLTRSALPSPAEAGNGHWDLSRNENAFSKPLSSSLCSFHTRTISRPSTVLRSENVVATDAFAARETSSSRATTYTSKREYLKAASVHATTRAARKLRSVSRSLTAAQWPDKVDQVLQLFLQHWWSIPAFLALVPLYTTYVAGVGDAAMPHWWPVTKMDHILRAPDAAMVLSVFLGSNIAFFLGGGYLMKKFPLIQVEKTSPTCTVGAASRIVPSFLLDFVSRLQTLRLSPTRQSWLGILLLLSGLISTIFHTEQALGSFEIANSLCYLDHAVAGTSTFYFFHTCGKPSKRVWALGIAGLAALSIVPPHPLPGYAWLHSAWHFLAAGAAVLWAVESFDDASQRSPRVQVLPSLSGDD